MRPCPPRLPALLLLAALAGRADWKTNPDARLAPRDGVMHISSVGRDPWIHTTVVPPAARGPFTLRLRAAGNASGNGAIYYLANPGQRYGQDRMVPYAFTHDGAHRDITVQIPVPTLAGLRIDPATLPGDIEITSLSLHDADGTEIKRWAGTP